MRAWVIRSTGGLDQLALDHLQQALNAGRAEGAKCPPRRATEEHGAGLVGRWT